MSAYCVITTIHKPTPAVKAWEERFGDKLIVIGDEKTPKKWHCGATRFYDQDKQRKARIQFKLMDRLPPNHYARKNIGYLLALHFGAESIFDTDDDNAPNDHWSEHEQQCAADVVRQKMWCNVYSMVHHGNPGWPRGFLLTRIHSCVQRRTFRKTIDSPIQQCMVNGDHDVDAIFRLMARPEHRGKIEFSVKKSIALSEGAWCPFNSQATWWFRDAFPLMYLPINCAFRCSDIWRSLVAQRCLWAMGKKVVFHSPAEVVQDRNAHDLMADFIDELPSYLNNEKIAKILEGLKLKRGKAAIYDNLRSCYQALIKEHVFPSDSEMPAVEAWIYDVKGILK